MRIQRAMSEYKLSNLTIKADKNWFNISFKRPDLQKESYEQRMDVQKGWSEEWSKRWSEKVSLRGRLRF